MARNNPPKIRPRKLSKISGITIGDLLLEAESKKSKVIVGFDKPLETVSTAQDCNLKVNSSFKKDFFNKAQQDKLRQIQMDKFAKELKEKSIQFLKIRNRKNLEQAKAEAYTMTVLFANDNVFACDSKPDNVFDAVQLSNHNLVEETS